MTRFLTRSLFEIIEVSRDRFRNGDRAMIRKGFVVGLDGVQVVKIVDHQPRGLAHAFTRGIAEEVQSLQPSSVAEMETGNRIERLPAGSLRPQVIERGQS